MITSWYDYCPRTMTLLLRAIATLLMALLAWLGLAGSVSTTSPTTTTTPGTVFVPLCGSKQDKGDPTGHICECLTPSQLTCSQALIPLNAGQPTTTPKS